MKRIKRFCVYFAVYVLMSVGAIMAIQHGWWYMIPSVVTITLGIQLIEYYARNYDKFKE